MHMAMTYIVRTEIIVCCLKNQKLIQIDSKFHTKCVLTSTSTVSHHCFKPGGYSKTVKLLKIVFVLNPWFC